MRYAIPAALLTALVIGCGKNPTTEAPREEPAPRPAPPEERPHPVPPVPKVDPKSDPAGTEPPVVKKEEPQRPRYDAPTAGEITIIQPVSLWAMPGVNRAQIKNKYFAKRWNVTIIGNTTVNPDELLVETHPQTEWLTITVRFRDPKDLLTFDRNKKLNGYCVDAFTFVDCVYAK
jgi:hypothetical protein